MAVRIAVQSVDYRNKLAFTILDESESNRAICVGINPLTFYEIGDDIIKEPTGYLGRREAQELADDLARAGFIAESGEMKRVKEENVFLRRLLEKLVLA